MTLVERFIDFRDWPECRKTARVGAIFGPVLLLGVGFVILVRPEAIDVPMLVRLVLGAFVIISLSATVGWVADRRGVEGRWTAYVMVFPTTAWLWLAVYTFGYLATPFVALPMMLGLFAALWWDARVALVSFVWGFGLSALCAVVTVTDVVPFAPAMVTRDIDGLRSTSWLLGVGLSLVGGTALVYLLGLVAVAASDLQSRRLTETHARLARAHALIRRYVPEQVADAVLSDTPEAIERHERRRLTIFFSDLVGFTDLSEELEPEDLASVLHDYFTEMNAIARRHGGTVDDLVGDAILVFFGAPERTDDHDQALRAVRMAVEMQEAMGPLNQRWASAGIPETLAVRMGVNTGVATVGNFGSAERTKYTALGKQVNVAARIQAQCEPGKVLISHATWLLVRDEVTCVPKGELTLKGLHKPMPAYEVQA
jgi:class 3 adenylate cyclase